MNPPIEIRDRNYLLRSRHKTRVPKPAQTASQVGLFLQHYPPIPTTRLLHRYSLRFQRHIPRAFIRSTWGTNTHRFRRAASYK